MGIHSILPSHAAPSSPHPGFSQHPQRTGVRRRGQTGLNSVSQNPEVHESWPGSLLDLQSCLGKGPGPAGQVSPQPHPSLCGRCLLGDGPREHPSFVGCGNLSSAPNLRSALSWGSSNIFKCFHGAEAGLEILPPWAEARGPGLLRPLYVSLNTPIHIFQSLGASGKPLSLSASSQ